MGREPSLSWGFLERRTDRRVTGRSDHAQGDYEARGSRREAVGEVPPRLAARSPKGDEGLAETT